MYDLQIVEETDQSCQEIEVDGFRVLVPNSSSHLLDGIEIDYGTDSWVGDSKLTIPTPNHRVAAANPSLEVVECLEWLTTMPLLQFGEVKTL